RTGVEVIVPTIAPQRIDTPVAVDPVVALRTAEHSVLAAEELQHGTVENLLPLAIDHGLAVAVEAQDVGSHTNDLGAKMKQIVAVERMGVGRTGGADARVV